MMRYRPPHPLEVRLFEEIKAKIGLINANANANAKFGSKAHRRVNDLIRILTEAGLVPSPTGGLNDIVALDEPDIVSAATPAFIAECNTVLNKALRGAHEA